jgi:hypothetical protein
MGIEQCVTALAKGECGHQFSADIDDYGTAWLGRQILDAIHLHTSHPSVRV